MFLCLQALDADIGKYSIRLGFRLHSTATEVVVGPRSRMHLHMCIVWGYCPVCPLHATMHSLIHRLDHGGRSGVTIGSL
jgi:hypothetical protein